MVTTSTPLKDTYAIINVALADGTVIVNNQPAGYKDTWTSAQVEKDGFHCPITTMIDGKMFKGSFMLYENPPKKKV
jgi:hypothetical protein